MTALYNRTTADLEIRLDQAEQDGNSGRVDRIEAELARRDYDESDPWK